MSTRSSNAARPAPGGLVDIVSGSFGAGHDAAASAIADQLHARGFQTRTWDVVDLMPGRLGRALRSGYLRQVQSARPVVLARCVRQPRHSPSGEGGDTGQNRGAGGDPRRRGSAGSGRGMERGRLHAPNLGRSRWSRNANERPGQVVVRFPAGAIRCRSGCAREGRLTHLSGTVAREPIEGPAT